MSTELEAGLNTPAPGPPIAAGCTHLVTAGPRQGERLPWPSGLPLFKEEPTLTRISNPLPAAYPVRDPIACDDEECVLRSIFAEGALNAAVDEVPLRQLVDMVDLVDGGARLLPSGAGISGVAVIDDVAASSFRLEVTGVGGGVIGLRRPYLLGYRATQAGKPLQTLRVQGNGLGIVVDDVAAGPVHVVYLRRRGTFLPLLLGVLVLAGLLRFGFRFGETATTHSGEATF